MFPRDPAGTLCGKKCNHGFFSFRWPNPTQKKKKAKKSKTKKWPTKNLGTHPQLMLGCKPDGCLMSLPYTWEQLVQDIQGVALSSSGAPSGIGYHFRCNVNIFGPVSTNLQKKIFGVGFGVLVPIWDLALVGAWNVRLRKGYQCQPP